MVASGRAVGLALCLGLGSGASASEAAVDEKKNTVFGEAFGSGAGLTVNYERAFTSRLSARLGGGLAADGKPSTEAFTIGAPPVPSDYSLLAAADIAIVGDRHQLFAGAGGRVLWINYGYAPQETKAGVFGEIGYRYLSRSGFLLKVTISSASIAWPDEDAFFPIPGVSLGWSF